MSNISVGQLGETIASKYLQDNGFRVLQKNIRTKFGEIDILAVKENSIHFVEVKTRIGDSHGKPYEAVNYYKLRHMTKSAQLYVLQKGLKDHKLSLDVISIILDTDQTVQDLKFYENITL